MRGMIRPMQRHLQNLCRGFSNATDSLWSTDRLRRWETRLLLLFLCSGVAVFANSTSRTVSSAATLEKEAVSTFCVDVNQGSDRELALLPGLGLGTARRIVDSRTDSGEFSSVEDLLRVKGIGHKTLLAVRPFLSANPPGEKSLVLGE